MRKIRPGHGRIQCIGLFGALVLMAVIPHVAGAQDFSVVSALGDSLTDTPAERGPNHAEHIADQLGVELNNFAQEGATSADLLDQGQHTDAVEVGTAFAFLWIGGNDLLSEHATQVLAGDHSFVADSVANWCEAADALLDAGADVIAANLPDPGSMPLAQLLLDPAGRENARAAAVAFNTALAEAAEARGIPLVDVFTLFGDVVASAPTVCGVEIGLPPESGDRADLFADEIHPSSYGMGLVTNAFIEVLNDSFGTSLEPLTEQELGELAGVHCSTLEDDSDGDEMCGACEGTRSRRGGAAGGGFCGVGLVGMIPGLLVGLGGCRSACRWRLAQRRSVIG